MSIPPFVLYSFVLASAWGLLFYLVAGRHGWVGLLVYWLAALLGFALGQTLATALGISLLPLGQVNVAEGSLFALLALFLLRAAWRAPEASH